MSAGRSAVLLAVVLVASLIGGAVATAPAAAQSCDTRVVHDAFMDDERAINALSNGTDVESFEENTRVRLGEANTFYQIEGENGNAYCVHFVVKVSNDAMPAAQLPAEIQSNDGNHEASWDAVHDFETGETYTQIEFTLGPGENATWSPNEIRIESISWASETRDRATGLIDRVSRQFGDDQDVTKRKYDITANASGEQVTVPLENPQTGEKINEWQARYTTDNGSTWYALDTDAEDPVFYTETEDSSSIRLTFNDPNARVKFVANPTSMDKIEEEFTMWRSGLRDIADRLPWSG
jgi:hypothetical protein